MEQVRGLIAGVATILLSVAALAAPWPLDTDFESPDYTVGDLNGQQGWSAVNDVTVSAESAAVYSGSQGVKLTSSSQAVYDADAVSNNVVWLQGYCKAEPVNFYPELPAPTSVTCFLFFHQTDGIVCLDGDGVGSGTWRATGIAANDWTRLSVRQDYSAHTWDVYVNGSKVFANMGNAYDNSAFDRFEAQAGETGPMYLDAFYSSPQSPFSGFGTAQAVTMNTDGQAGAFLYNYATFDLQWVDWTTSSYAASYNLLPQQWYGVFLYDYATASYEGAVYVLKNEY